MIALLIMPIVIEMITRGVMIQLAGGTVLTLAEGMIAKGELCALTWLPFMAMCAWNHCNGPEPQPLPPERAEYTSQKEDQKRELAVEQRSRHMEDSMECLGCMGPKQHQKGHVWQPALFTSISEELPVASEAGKQGKEQSRDDGDEAGNHQLLCCIGAWGADKV
jgi:hypothetical protein